MEKDGDECIIYTQTIVPNTMRSTYWKYFGFPGNDNQEILTKNKVVCTLCNKVISYNKNTSNLRTHLFAKHPEKLFGMNNVNNHSEPASPVTKKPKPKKLFVKTEILEPNEVFIDEIEEPEEYDYIPDQGTDAFTTVHQQPKVVQDQSPSVHGYDVIQCPEEIEQATIGTMTSVSEEAPCSSQLVDVVVKDLVDPGCFSGKEFRNFLSRNGLFLESNELENVLREEYETVSGMETSPSKQFSLGLEMFENFEGTKFLNVFITVLEETSLKTKLFAVVKYEAESTLDELVTRIDLNNCTAVVISSNIHEEELEIYFIVRDIPIVWCLHSVLKRIIGRVFQLDVVSVSLFSTFIFH